jgi:hypothetical protein
MNFVSDQLFKAVQPSAFSLNLPIFSMSNSDRPKSSSLDAALSSAVAELVPDGCLYPSLFQDNHT